MTALTARSRLLALVLALGVALAAACDDDGDGLTDPGPDLPGDLADRIEALFPEGATRDLALDRVEAILDQSSDDLLFDFIAFGSAELEAGRLLDPGGDDPPTSEAALADLFEAVADAAGLDPPPINEGALATGAVAFVDQDGMTVVTRSGFGGVDFPAGALPGRTLIVLERLPEEGDPGEGPLPTELDQYPIFYQVTTFPEVDELSAEAVAGLCVVDPPDPFAPAPDVAARLRLAHPDPDDPAEIEFLPLMDAPFVDCTGATTDDGLGLASPGRLGGAISAFSPIVAVDPLSGGPEPLILTLDMPATVPNTPGSTITGTFEFADPEGDIVLAVVEAVSGPLNGFEFDPEIRGQTTGTFDVVISCPEGEDPCATGEVHATLTLLDAGQNVSRPFPFSYTAVEP